MRVGNDPELQQFDDWLGSIGNGSLETVEDPDWVDIRHPEVLLTTIDNTNEETVATSLDGFIKEVFPNIKDHIKSENWSNWISERAILAPKNVEVDNINLHIINEVPGDATTLWSSDATVNTSDQTMFPVEVLNSHTPAGLPPHQLTLKVCTNHTLIIHSNLSNCI